jgi:hypothetical protein
MAPKPFRETRMLKPALVVLSLVAVTVATASSAEARHRRHNWSMHGWCRADAAQMMGVRRSAVHLEPRAARTAGGRYELRGLASHGRYGQRAFTCHFNARGALQGAV